MTRRAIQGSVRGRAGIAAATLAATFLSLMDGVVRAQDPPAPPKPRFDVASIRRSKAPDQSNRISPTPQGGLRAQNVTVLQLIALAYGVRPFLVVDAPGWASAERYDVLTTLDSPDELAPNAAGAQRDAFRDRFRQRVQSLLAERFGLVVRAEKRPMPVYQLVVAKGGHKMKASTAEEPRRMESSSRTLRGAGVGMKELADSISGILVRPVIDETNLAGAFTFEMQFADVRAQANPEGGDAAAAPTIFTAIGETMGLKLEPARAPAPVFVVEKVQRPSEN
jgi:uncharacterized protein (TIGR03435 family)